MNESTEFPQEKPFSEIEEEMREKGFHYNGVRSLTTFTFSKDAKFVAVPVKTKGEVMAEEKDYYQKQGVEVDVELVDQAGLSQNQRAIHVFVRPKI